MEPVTILITIALIHCGLYFFDTFFKSCSHYPYIYFLQNTGIHIEPLKVRWFTTAFNRIFQKWGTSHLKLVQCWFTVGSWFSLGLLPLASYILVKSTIDVLQSGSEENNAGQTVTLEIMVPGLNLPLSDLGYYSITLIICSAVHEFGHAVAAVREDVHIYGCGVIVMFIVPLAYVHLNLEQLESLPPKRQLRILCAGIWHNIVLAVLAATALALLPLIFYPAFDSGSGVAVQSVTENSPLSGPVGLHPDDRVVALNQCEVLDNESWYNCILLAIKHQSPGYCTSSELAKEHDESVPVQQLPGGAVECCAPSSTQHLCFEYLEAEGAALELPQHSCLPGRVVVEAAELMCWRAGDCTSGLHCLRPSLENSTKLVRIERLDAKVVLYIGNPAQIFHMVQVSDYVPLYFLSSAIPDMITRLCKYIIIFSAGLAAINVIPCFYLDGQYIIHALTDFFLMKKVPMKSVREVTSMFFTVFGTFFLSLYMFSVTISKFIFK